MPLTRVFVFAMLVALGAGMASAQSQANSDSLAVSQNAQAADSSFSAASDELLPLLSLTGEAGLQSAGDIDPAGRIRVDLYQPHGTEMFDFHGTEVPDLSARHILLLSQLGLDGGCLRIRSYRVVRDSPHSDSVHRVAYTTCVPAARVQLYTTVEQKRLP